jgi:hypothetical protein
MKYYFGKAPVPNNILSSILTHAPKDAITSPTNELNAVKQPAALAVQASPKTCPCPSAAAIVPGLWWGRAQRQRSTDHAGAARPASNSIAFFNRPDNGGGKHVVIVGQFLPECTTQHPRSHLLSCTYSSH